MSFLAWLSASLGVVSLGLTGAVWYYRSTLAAARESLNSLTKAGAQWSAVHDMQVKQLGALQRALADRQVKEATDDEATAHAAAGNAADAANLLNSLHKNNPRTGARLPAPLQSGTATGISRGTGKGLR